MAFVIDACAAVEYLLRTQVGLRIGQMVEGALLIAPQLLDVEVMSVLRRAVLGERLAEERARIALEDLKAWPLERIAHIRLIEQAWQHRSNVTAYDAFYVAAARLYEIPLLTTDGPLSRAPSLGITVQNVRMA